MKENLTGLFLEQQLKGTSPRGTDNCRQILCGQSCSKKELTFFELQVFT